MAESIVLLLLTYVAVGVPVAVFLVFFAAARFDRAAVESTRGFRVIVLPGAILLWPLLLRRALATRSVPPVERNAHRVQAERGADA